MGLVILWLLCILVSILTTSNVTGLPPETSSQVAVDLKEASSSDIMKDTHLVETESSDKNALERLDDRKDTPGYVSRKPERLMLTRVLSFTRHFTKKKSPNTPSTPSTPNTPNTPGSSKVRSRQEWTGITQLLENIHKEFQDLENALEQVKREVNLKEFNWNPNSRDSYLSSMTKLVKIKPWILEKIEKVYQSNIHGSVYLENLPPQADRIINSKVFDSKEYLSHVKTCLSILCVPYFHSMHTSKEVVYQHEMLVYSMLEYMVKYQLVNVDELSVVVDDESFMRHLKDHLQHCLGSLVYKFHLDLDSTLRTDKATEHLHEFFSVLKPEKRQKIVYDLVVENYKFFLDSRNQAVTRLVFGSEAVMASLRNFFTPEFNSGLSGEVEQENFTYETLEKLVEVLSQPSAAPNALIEDLQKKYSCIYYILKYSFDFQTSEFVNHPKLKDLKVSVGNRLILLGKVLEFYALAHNASLDLQHSGAMQRPLKFQNSISGVNNYPGLRRLSQEHIKLAETAFHQISPRSDFLNQLKSPEKVDLGEWHKRLTDLNKISQSFRTTVFPGLSLSSGEKVWLKSQFNQSLLRSAQRFLGEAVSIYNNGPHSSGKHLLKQKSFG